MYRQRVLKLIIHPLCLSSLKILKRIREKKLYNKIEIVSATLLGDKFLNTMILSIPMFIKNDHIVGIDPLEPEYVEAIIANDMITINQYLPKTPKEALDRFLSSIRSSSYITTRLVIEPRQVINLLNNVFVSAALRGYFLGEEKTRGYILYIKSRINSLIPKIYDYSQRSAIYNYMREQYLINPMEKEEFKKKILDKHEFILWLQAKISMERAYTFPELILDPRRIMDLADHILVILDEVFDKYFEIVKWEISELKEQKDLIKWTINITSS